MICSGKFPDVSGSRIDRVLKCGVMQLVGYVTIRFIWRKSNHCEIIPYLGRNLLNKIVIFADLQRAGLWYTRIIAFKHVEICCIWYSFLGTMAVAIRGSLYFEVWASAALLADYGYKWIGINFSCYNYYQWRRVGISQGMFHASVQRAYMYNYTPLLN